MSIDRDLELGAALNELPTPEHDSGFWEELEERLAGEPPVQRLADLRTRRFKPRTMWLLSAAAAVAMVVGAVLLLPGDDNGVEVRVTETTIPGEEGWTILPDSPLSPRSGPLTVWTGEQMLVWGGEGPDNVALGDGAAYDPSSQGWTPMADSPTGPLVEASAVWTGNRMLVWGTRASGPGETALATAGAAYDPSADEWTAISDAPLRTEGGATAVWEGDQMLVWGGSVGESPVGEGASYDPSTDRWTELPPAPIPDRFDHTAVWTGDRMIVWGGYSGEESPSRAVFADGAAYDPSTGDWETLPAAPIAGRAQHTATWVSNEMVVWGGSMPVELANDGAAYDPSTRSWRLLPASPLSPRLFGTAVAAGDSLLLVWGGSGDENLADGAALDLAAGTWAPLEGSPLVARIRHAAVWTGSSMLVWGGLDQTRSGQDPLGDGAAFRPGSGGPAAAPPTARR